MFSKRVLHLNHWTCVPRSNMTSLLVLPALVKQVHGDLAEAEPVILHRCWTITLDQKHYKP